MKKHFWIYLSLILIIIVFVLLPANIKTLLGTTSLQEPVIQDTPQPYVFPSTIEPVSPSQTSEILFFQELSDGSSLLLMMDGDGNRTQKIGIFTGSPAWSPDGKYIAVGCEDTNFICILDVNGIPNKRNFPPDYESLSSLIRSEIPLPAECDAYKFPSWGLSSISWSFDATKLAIVCEEFDKSSEKKTGASVCIVPTDQTKPTCLDETDAVFKWTTRAVWSPVANILALSSTGIYTVNPDGSDLVLLDRDGLSPEWSPDGKQIVYIQRDIETQYYPGIVLINSDGSNPRWLYKPNPNWDSDALYYRLHLSCDWLSTNCRLTWSSDGRYVSLSSGWQDVYFFGLFRIDLQTGDIIILASDGGNYSEPDWGP